MMETSKIMRPVYVSQIKLFGVPIIGPCMNEIKRSEMRALRDKAVEVERRLSKKFHIISDSLDGCESEVALLQTNSASNATNLASSKNSLASKEATTVSLYSSDLISKQALAIEIHSPSSSACTGSAASPNPELSQSFELADFSKTYLSFPPLEPEISIEDQLCFQADADSSGSVDLNLDMTASSVGSPHRPHDLSLLESIHAPNVSLVSPGLSESRQRIDFKKCFRDFLTQKLAELDPAGCQDTLTDFSQPIEPRKALQPITVADLSAEPPTLESNLLEVPLLVRQNSYTLLDGPSALIIAHVERNKPATVTSTPNHGARNNPTNASSRNSRSSRVTGVPLTNYSPRFGGIGSPTSSRCSPRRSSSQDSGTSNRSPAKAGGAGLRRRGWDLDNARAFWASSDALDRMFSVPRVKPVSVPPKARGKQDGGANPSGNISLPTSASSSPAKTLHRFEAFSSLDALPSPAASRPIRRSLFPKHTNRPPARAVVSSHWLPPARHSIPPRRDSRGAVKNIFPETALPNRETTPVGSPCSISKTVASVGSNREAIGSPNYASDVMESVFSSRDDISSSPKSARFVIGSPNYTSDLTASVCSSRDDVIESPKSRSAIYSPNYNRFGSESSCREEIIESPNTRDMIDFSINTNNVIGSASPSPKEIGRLKSPHEEIVTPKPQVDVIASAKSPGIIESPTVSYDPISTGDLATDDESPFMRLQREHHRQMALLAARHREDAERLRREFAEQELQLLEAFGRGDITPESGQLQDSEPLLDVKARTTSKAAAPSDGLLVLNGNGVALAQREVVSARNSINARDSLMGEKENVCDWYASSELNSLPRSGARRGDHAFRELHMNGQTAVTAFSRSSSRSSEGTVSSDGFAESCASWQLRHNSPAAERRPPPTDREKRAAAVIVGAARGFLVRRLLRTAHVRDIRTTIRDVTLATLQLHTENHDAPRPEDVELGRRFIHQLNASWLALYETFFVLPTEKKLALIAADRARIGARVTPASGRLSSATERFRRRKQAGSTNTTISRQSSRPPSAISTISAISRNSSVSRNSANTMTPRISSTPRPEQSKLKPWR